MIPRLLDSFLKQQYKLEEFAGVARKEATDWQIGAE